MLKQIVILVCFVGGSLAVLPKNHFGLRSALALNQTEDIFDS